MRKEKIDEMISDILESMPANQSFQSQGENEPSSVFISGTNSFTGSNIHVGDIDNSTINHHHGPAHLNQALQADPEKGLEPCPTCHLVQSNHSECCKKCGLNIKEYWKCWHGYVRRNNGIAKLSRIQYWLKLTAFLSFILLLSSANIINIHIIFLIIALASFVVSVLGMNATSHVIKRLSSELAHNRFTNPNKAN